MKGELKGWLFAWVDATFSFWKGEEMNREPGRIWGIFHCLLKALELNK